MSSDYFEVFGLPRHLRVDLPALEKAFYVQSRKLHPDRFAAKPAAEQEAALAASSQLNDAYRTLKDPIARTQYLLSLEGIELEEQSKAATEKARASGELKKQVVPPELLEEVFELNMQLMELKAARAMGDDADPENVTALAGQLHAFQGQMDMLQDQLGTFHDQWDTAFDASDISGRYMATEGMVALLNKRTYLRNLIRDVREALGED